MSVGRYFSNYVVKYLIRLFNFLSWIEDLFLKRRISIIHYCSVQKYPDISLTEIDPTIF